MGKSNYDELTEIVLRTRGQWLLVITQVYFEGQHK